MIAATEKRELEGQCMSQHAYVFSHSVVSYSFRPHGQQPSRLFVHGIFLASIVEWVVISSFRGYS